jgi:hypothetical protein
MFDFSLLNDQEIYRLRDCCVMIIALGFTMVRELLQETNQEIQDRERKINGEEIK